MTWLPEDEWVRLQAVIPIAVVDVVPIAPDDVPLRVGLIRRQTPHQGERWNLVGGRIRRGETVSEALRRQVAETLGGRASVDVADDIQPHYVAQYAPEIRPPFSYDPRKHAIGLTFALRIDGEIAPRGEAVGFEWFDAKALPPSTAWGFQQDRPAAECLERAGIQYAFAGS